MTPPVRSESWRADLGWYVGIVVACGVAFGVGQSLLAGIVAAGGMAAFTLVLALGRRRFDAVRVVGGAGDERNRELYTRSLAVAGGVVGLLITGWFLVGVARGETDGELAALTLVFAATFLVSAIAHSRRG